MKNGSGFEEVLDETTQICAIKKSIKLLKRNELKAAGRTAPPAEPKTPLMSIACKSKFRLKKKDQTTPDLELGKSLH